MPFSYVFPGIVTSPCHVQWSLLWYDASSTCTAAVSTSDLVWQSDSSSGAIVNNTAVANAAVDTFGVVRFVLYTRAVDAASNVGAVSSVEWWIDVVYPAVPVLQTTPDLISLLPSATFVFKLAGDTSAGQATLLYHLVLTRGTQSVNVTSLDSVNGVCFVCVRWGSVWIVPLVLL